MLSIQEPASRALETHLCGLQVLNAESGNLDPMRVLEALSEDMPLSIAYSTLSRMLRERIHRKRQTGIVHQLYRSREVLSRSEQ